MSTLTAVVPRLFFGHTISDTVQVLLRRPQYAQRTPEWHMARTELLTASAAAAALMRTRTACQLYMDTFGFTLETFPLNPKKTCAYKDTQLDLILSKCDVGDAVPAFTGNEFTEWGQKYEPIAALIYSQMQQRDVLEFGLLRHPAYSFMGASPDGITTDGVMLEIKCPPCRAVSPVPPIYYWIQMLLQLECTGLSVCDFMDCHFVEYVNVLDWRYDALQWEKEKNVEYHVFGIFITNTATGEHSYAPPTVVTCTQFIEWRDNQFCEIRDCNEYDDDYTVTYYKLQQHYITRVNYSREWFMNNLGAFEAVWNKILFLRSPEGRNELDAILAKKHSRRRKDPPAQSPGSPVETIDSDEAGLPTSAPLPSP